MLGNKQTFYGNLGATTDSYFLVNGNVPDHRVLIRGRDDVIGLGLAEAESEDHSANVTVAGSFVEEELDGGHLRHFIVVAFVPHTSIAQRAFAISTSGESRTPQENWLSAERELLGA